MSQQDYSAFTGFAHPNSDLNEALPAMVSQGFANSVILRAAAQKSVESDIATKLCEWTSKVRPISQSWFASISKIGRRVFEEGNSVDSEQIGRLLIDLAPALGDFDYSFEGPSGLPIAHFGRLYGATGRVQLSNRKGQLSIEGLDDGPILAIDGEITFVETRQSVDTLCQDCVPALPLDAEQSGNFGWAAEISEGLELMKSVSDVYDRWVRRLLRTLVITERLENRTCSGSWSDTSGTVYLSQPNALVEVGEVLIHECAHQHFHLAMRVAPMKTPEATSHYYSPAVKRKRPLDMILIAYHAFANVLTYYERAFDKSLGNALSHNRYDNFLRDVNVLESYLDNNKGLSVLGHTIFKALQENRRNAELGELVYETA